MKLPEGLHGPLGLFGGTFDPVHNGHLRTAFELRERFSFERVHFLPAATPPHREKPIASFDLRAAMLEAALAEDPDCIVDRRELDRDGPSYTIDTAQSFRAEFPDRVLCLMLGMDAFAGLLGWRSWQALLDLVNLIVARRPGSELPDDDGIGALLEQRRIEPTPDREWARAGQIIIQDVTQLEIASTDLRSSIRDGITPRYLVPDAVWDIMAASGCYAR